MNQCKKKNKNTPITSDEIKILFLKIFPQFFLLVSNLLVDKAMEKEAKTHRVAGNRTAVTRSRATSFVQRWSIWVPQIQSSQRKMMFSVYSYDIIPIIKMSLESLCLHECHHYRIRYDSQSGFCTVNSTRQPQSILPSFSSSLSFSQKLWWLFLVQSWDSRSQQYWDCASQQQLQCKLSSVLGLFMGFPLSSEQKDSRKLLAITYLAPLLDANHYSNWNRFALKICSKSLCLFFSTRIPLWVEIFLSTCAYGNYLKPFSYADHRAELIPVLSESFHLHLSICFLPEKEHLCALFCHFLFQLRLNPANYTMEFENKFNSFRTESLKAEGNKCSLTIISLIYVNCYIYFNNQKLIVPQVKCNSSNSSFYWIYQFSVVILPFESIV